MDPRHAAIFILSPILLQAQPQLPGLWGSPVITIPCPQDPGTMIETYEGWEAYQTTDDTWNGPREPGVCIDLAHSPGPTFQARIDFDQSILPKPVFLRLTLDSASAIPLTSNNEYFFELSGFALPGTTLDYGNTCPDGVCTGVLAAVRIPDSLGTGSDLRWYQASSAPQMLNGPFSTCVPTEYFEENALRELIFKFTPTGTATGQQFRLFSASSTDLTLDGSLVPLTESVLPEYQVAPASYLFGWNIGYNYLVMYEEATYPGPGHTSYLDLTPMPNTAAPTEVTVTLDAFTGFNFQPYTQLRGGAVVGNDTLFHSLTVVNNGADLCLGWAIVEVVWEEGSRYVHQAGHLAMEGRNSCFMFKPGSTLEVPSGSTLHYGTGNRGMLAMINGSALEIGNGGELVMHGTLVIKEAPYVTEHQDMFLTLRQGAKLTFAAGSRIHNAFSVDGRMRLMVTLDGGEIDLDGLSLEDREKVVVISLPKENWTEFELMGNPVAEDLVIAFNSRTEGMVRFRALDAMGRLVLTSQQSVQQGENRVTLPVRQIGSGTYLLEATFDEKRQVVRFVRN